jgi:hypothetical protein
MMSAFENSKLNLPLFRRSATSTSDSFLPCWRVLLGVAEPDHGHPAQ